VERRRLRTRLLDGLLRLPRQMGADRGTDDPRQGEEACEEVGACRVGRTLSPAHTAGLIAFHSADSALAGPFTNPTISTVHERIKPTAASRWVSFMTSSCHGSAPLAPA